MAKRTTDEWEALLDGWVTVAQGANLIEAKAALKRMEEQRRAAPESVAEVVRLRRALEERREYLVDALSNESIESYDDLDKAWVSVQKYGELSEMIDERNILTRILEGGNNE